MMKQTSAILVLGLLLAPVSRTGLPASAADKPSKLRIGISGHMFREIPDATAKQALETLRALIQTQTGFSSEFTIEDSIDKLSGELMKDKLDFVVLIGYEFAWAQQKHDKLRPLVIAVNRENQLYAHLIVREDAQVGKWADLQGKKLALPTGSRPHCRLLVERKCSAAGKTPASFFAKITTPENIEDALDDVVDGVVDAAVVDGFCLDCFKRRKPGRSAKLKGVLKSEVFPPPAIAYRPGALDEATVNRFRDDLVRTSQTDDGQRLLTLWKLTAFEPVPATYEKNLSAILKAYPPPKSK